jgi:hypothetical protein
MTEFLEDKYWRKVKSGLGLGAGTGSLGSSLVLSGSGRVKVGKVVVEVLFFNMVVV